MQRGTRDTGEVTRLGGREGGRDGGLEAGLGVGVLAGEPQGEAEGVWLLLPFPELNMFLYIFLKNLLASSQHLPVWIRVQLKVLVDAGGGPA